MNQFLNEVVEASNENEKTLNRTSLGTQGIQSPQEGILREKIERLLEVLSSTESNIYQIQGKLFTPYPVDPKENDTKKLQNDSSLETLIYKVSEVSAAIEDLVYQINKRL
jgi:hypothetical protein